MAMAAVDNGVNVQALLDARDALKGSPEATQFTWRASCKWVNGTHSQATVKGFFGLGEEQSHKTETSFEADHPEIFASEDNGITPIEYVLVGLASCLTAGIAAVAQNRGVQLRSVESKLEGKMDIQGILGMDSDVRNGYERHQGDLRHRRGRVEAGHRGDRRAVAEALGRVRRDHEPRERHRRSGLEPSSSSRRSSSGPVTLGSRPAGFSPKRSIDHVLLERGDVANSWRRERWESLRLLTPNWQSRLPGHRYDGPDPDGYMTMPEVIEFISRFATVSSAPVRTNTNVTSVTRTDDGYHIATTNGDIRCRCVVLASGACNLPSVPALRSSGAAVCRADHPVRLSRSLPVARRGCARRRRVGHRRAARRVRFTARGDR